MIGSSAAGSYRSVDDGETVIEHRVEMRGPMTFLFRHVIGANIEKGLSTAVARLARMAEDDA